MSLMDDKLKEIIEPLTQIKNSEISEAVKSDVEKYGNIQPKTLNEIKEYLEEKSQKFAEAIDNLTGILKEAIDKTTESKDG